MLAEPLRRALAAAEIRLMVVEEAAPDQVKIHFRSRCTGPSLMAAWTGAGG